jgi:NAD(P)-dependent dehydrogenase (short-subunit alcohol dehydrogenase family)
MLVGRNPPTKEIEQQLSDIRSRDIDVTVRLCDVGNFEECKQLLDDINLIPVDKDGVSQSPRYPPLRGIMHAAGVLADGTLETQTWEKYEAVFNAKIKGSWNLHQLTLDLRYPLEHFVMYSSLAAVFGSIGQSNHAGGNYYLDSLVHYRNSIGLPGTTINWGQWGQVGVAANLVNKKTN